MANEVPPKKLGRGIGNPKWYKGMPSPHPHGRGRPKREDCLVSCIKEELAAQHKNSKFTNEQMIAKMLVQKAALGDIKAIELVLSYTTPKPQASLAVSTPEGQKPPVSFTFLMPDGTKFSPKDMANANGNKK